MEDKKVNSFELKKTVLIVDDEEINRDILAMQLSNDFNILEADDGKAAIDLLLDPEHKIDLVVIDVNMPYSGQQVLKDRQENPKLRSIPFFVCTSEKETEESCFYLGANDFIKKPFSDINFSIVIARMKRLIELYEDRSILRDTEREKLTNFFNREFFKIHAKRLDAELPDIKKDMIAVSINRFRLLNELYGHAFGDKVLLAIRDTMNHCLLTGCRAVFGKDGGSRFIIYAEHHDSYDMLVDKLNESIKAISENINVSFRVGVYPNVDPNLDKETVVGRAEATADTLINNLTKSIEYYDEAKQAKTLHMEELIDNFHQALEEEQFKLYFQPKYNVQGDKPVFASAEVLVRWISPKFGFVSPGDFIPLFEENGLISQLDSYILEKAAEYMSKWQKKYGITIPLSINLSRVNIYNPTLVEDIIKIVDTNKIPREAYYIEITESAFVEDANIVIPVISKIRDSGFKVEIDDFGSGYSSFNALIDLPFDVLKIDMAIIRSMDKSPKVRDIIKMIINLSKTMEAITVAEGVETEEQCKFLKDSGCDVIQGYYFSKPLPIDDFEKLIEKDLI